jgi:hypothetical protein
MSLKKALLVGINHYSMPDSDLRGCLNDVETYFNILTSKFGFTDITILKDNQATAQNIKINLEQIVEDFKDCNSPEDKFVFCFSGHGSSIPDKEGDEIDGLDEIICNYDLNWSDKIITDDYLYSTFLKLNSNIHSLIISDSCHSGSLLRSLSLHHVNYYYKNKYIKPPQEIFDKIKSSIYDNDAAVADQMIRIRNKKEDFNKRNGILISGCQSNQTSADAEINGSPCGAMTYVLSQILNNSNYNIAYADLIVGMNKLLDDLGYEQNPQLECPDVWKNKKFLGD